MKKKISKIAFIGMIISAFFSINTFALGWEHDGIGWRYIDASGVPKTETIQMSNDKKFYLDENGYVVYDYLLEEHNGGVYYFNDDGEMVTNTWVAVDPFQVENQMDNAPSVYLYYFGNNGKAYRATNGGVRRKTIDGKPYLFNEYGQMLSGWINEDGTRYDEYNTEEDPFVGNIYYGGDETDGVLRSGWLEYMEGSITDQYYQKTTLWFYFNKKTNKKIYSDSSIDYISKKINGNDYAFDENGVMLTGWEAEPTSKFYHDEDSNKSMEGKLLRKEWVYTVPSAEIDYRDNQEDVERWFYSLGNGNIAKNSIKKINGKYYAFNTNGIMKAGFVIFDKKNRTYVDTIDIDFTDGSDFLVSKYYISEDSEDYALFDVNNHIIYYFENDNLSPDYGARKTGKVNVALSDRDYEFHSDTRGAYQGVSKKIYYEQGIKLTADPNIGLGMVLVGYEDMATGDILKDLEYNNSTHPYANKDEQHEDNLNDYIIDYLNTSYKPLFVMVDSKGMRNLKVNSMKRDKEKHYWLLDKNGFVEKILEVEVKYVSSASAWYYKSTPKGKSSSKKWLKMATATDPGEVDAYGRCPSIVRGEGDYEVYIDNTYGMNFRLKLQ